MISDWSYVWFLGIVLKFVEGVSFKFLLGIFVGIMGFLLRIWGGIMLNCYYRSRF